MRGLLCSGSDQRRRALRVLRLGYGSHYCGHRRFRLVHWFTPACINAGLAEGKGRSRLNWFLLSILIGPLATMLVVILHPLRP